MPHSLRAKLSGLRYKGILEDKDYKRLCHALDLEKAEQEPCDDVVSRQAIMKLKRHNLVEGQFVSLYDIEQLPSVRPQEQTGHWIETEYHRWKCSVCREKGMSEWDNIHDVRTNFCPNCGARMVEPQESEDKE